MKKIVKGNDFTMLVHVVKMVDGRKVPFSLPSCEELHARAVGRFSRYGLEVRVDASDDSVLLARVEGGRLPVGEYALEVCGKLFGNDWRSNEYGQFALVDSNAEADTEFSRDLVEGEDSVEMDTAVVFLPPGQELSEIAGRFRDETLDGVRRETDALRRDFNHAEEAETARAEAERGRTDAETARDRAEQGRKDAEAARVKAGALRDTAENERAEAETGRARAEGTRSEAERSRSEAEASRNGAETLRVTAEGERLRAEKERAKAESTRAEAEEARALKDKGRDEAVTHLEELLKYIKEGGYENDVKVVEAIKAAPKEPTHDVWLDTADGEIKVTEAVGKLSKTAYKYYYVGRRLVKGDMTNITEGNTWAGNNHIRSLDLSGWDMTLCTGVPQLFYQCKNLRYLDISGWNLSAVTNASYMFFGCSSLQSLDTSGWQLGAVTDASDMFRECRSLQSLDTSGWQLGAVISTSLMFNNCSSLQSLDTSGWKLDKLTNAYGMFNGCSSLQSLDTSGWNLSAVTNAYGMFNGCSSLQSLDARNWKMRHVADLTSMFRYCSKITSVDMRNSDFSNVTAASYMFAFTGMLTELWLPLTFDRLTSLDLSIPGWGKTGKGLESLRWTFGEGADDRTAKGLPPCTVRLSGGAYDLLTDGERTAAAAKGWTLTK